jgi:hypothetical protein
VERPRHTADEFVGVSSVLAPAKKRGFLAGEGRELGGEVLDVAGVEWMVEDLLDCG